MKKILLFFILLAGIGTMRAQTNDLTSEELDAFKVVLKGNLSAFVSLAEQLGVAKLVEGLLQSTGIFG